MNFLHTFPVYGWQLPPAFSFGVRLGRSALIIRPPSDDAEAVIDREADRPEKSSGDLP